MSGLHCRNTACARPFGGPVRFCPFCGYQQAARVEWPPEPLAVAVEAEPDLVPETALAPVSASMPVSSSVPISASVPAHSATSHANLGETARPVPKPARVQNLHNSPWEIAGSRPAGSRLGRVARRFLLACVRAIGMLMLIVVAATLFVMAWQRTAQEGRSPTVSRSASAGQIVITPYPDIGAQVLVDDAEVGAAGERLAVAPGLHTVTLRSSSATFVPRQVQVRAGQVTALTMVARTPDPLLDESDAFVRQHTLIAPPAGFSQPLAVQGGDRLVLLPDGRIRVTLPGHDVQLGAGRTVLQAERQGWLRATGLESSPVTVRVGVLSPDR